LPFYFSIVNDDPDAYFVSTKVMRGAPDMAGGYEQFPPGYATTFVAASFHVSGLSAPSVLFKFKSSTIWYADYLQVASSPIEAAQGAAERLDIEAWTGTNVDSGDFDDFELDEIARGNVNGQQVMSLAPSMEARDTSKGWKGLSPLVWVAITILLSGVYWSYDVLKCFEFRIC
jgi:hypothetical protein